MHYYKQIVIHIFVFIFLPLLTTGCAGVPSRWVNTTQGEALSQDQAAILEYFHWLPEHEIEIDGKYYPTKSMREMVHFILAPGEHNIYFITSSMSVGEFGSECDIEFKAGNRYRIGSKRYNQGTFLRKDYYAQGYVFNIETKEKFYCK